MVHRHCRGYVHRTVLYSTYLQVTVLICALSSRSFQVLKAVHTVVGLYANNCRSSNHYTKPSAHTAAEVVHAHSWDLTFLTKLALASHQFILHQNPSLTHLQECLFIECTYYKTMGLNHGHPETINPGLKPWVNYKKRTLTQPRHP